MPLNSDERIHHARMVWDLVWNQQYSWQYAFERLKGYGLTDKQISAIANLTEALADEWNAQKNHREYNSF